MYFHLKPLTLLLHLLPLALSLPQSSTGSDNGASDLPSFSGPTSYGTPGNNPNYLLDAAHIQYIKQTISLFPLFVDSVHYSSLDCVFTSDAVGYLDHTGTESKGLSQITSKIAELKNVPSQHHLTTEFVTLTGSNTANATNYLISKYFGTGTKSNQVFTVYGVYEWMLLLTDAGWRAKYIQLIYRDTNGNSSIVG